MPKRIIISTGSFVIALVLSFDLYFSVIAGRPLSPAEATRFSRVITRATLLHSNEGGGRQALNITKLVLAHPVTSGEIDLPERHISYPLPRYTIEWKSEEGSHQYLSCASAEELEDYFYRVMPAASWRHLEQMGAGHFFEKDGDNLTITQHFYLTSGISKVNVSVSRFRRCMIYCGVRPRIVRLLV